MSFSPRLRSWLAATFRRAALERRMQTEMETHVDLYEADLRRQGLSPAEARRRARAEFGSISARKDECREAVGLRVVGDFRADTAYALRLLRRSPGFALVALLSLALGIGANTAIFSLIDTVLMKDLPVRDPSGLFFVDTSGGKSGGNSGPPYPLFESMRDNSRFLSGIAAFSEDRFKVTIVGVTEPEFFGLQVGSPIDLTIPMMLAGNQLRSKGMWWMSAVARLRPGASAAQAQAELDAMFGRYLPEANMKRDRIATSLLRERLLSMLATFFGALALALACIGLYGVMSYAVVRRTREIGIRIAVGAGCRAVIWLMVREMLVLVAAGTLLGALLAFAATRYVSSQFFGVAPGDPLATLAAVALLLTVTLTAAYVPARRASRIDPVMALRCE